MACGRPITLFIQMGVLLAAGTVLGVIDSKMRPVLVNAPKMAPLDIPAPPNPAPTAPDSTTPAPTDTPAATPGTDPATPQNPPQGEQPQATPAAPAPAPSGVEVISDDLVAEGHITIAQAFALFNAPQPAIFLDARRKEIFEEGHVKMAFRLPLDAFKGREPAHFQVMDRSETYVVYCEGGNCDESVAVQKQLVLSGYTKVYVMHAGYPAWSKAGHPTEVGPDPIEQSEGRP